MADLKEKGYKMLYKDFQGMKLSALGFGTMRLPVIDGKDADIDVKETEKMIDLAMKNGINYYDTAWGYHDGNSETVVGKLLSKYDRDKYYLATKFPGYDLNNMGKAKEIFEKQLEKTGVSYFDFYLVHNVCELNIDAYLDPTKPDVEYLIEMKKEGKIRHLGFSSHGSLEVIERFLKKYGDHMEFCQLQLNYLDWEFQHDDEKYAMLTKRGIPVWVMEPLRGGRLVRLSRSETEALDNVKDGITPLEAAFGFLQSFQNITVTLSGMSSISQMEQNIAIYEKENPLSEKEKEKLLTMAKGMIGSSTVPCTGCHYCVSHCPAELDIPRLLELYNEHNFAGGGFLAPFGLRALGEGQQPSDCLGCGSCAAVCPQRIKIPEILEKFAAMMEK